VARNASAFVQDTTLAGYQDRVLAEYPEFFNNATNLRRIAREYQQQAEQQRRSRRLLQASESLQLANRALSDYSLPAARSNYIARILGFAEPFPPLPPPPPPEEYWRISMLRQWDANVAKRTPVPWLELRVYVFTRNPRNPDWSESSLDDALDAVEEHLFITGGEADSRPTTHGVERENIDEDELEQENSHQRRGGGDRINWEEMWYYIAFWELVNGIPRIFRQYYGRVHGPPWRADPPNQRAVARGPPSFGTTIVVTAP
jgi:hypothetical protein